MIARGTSVTPIPDEFEVVPDLGVPTRGYRYLSPALALPVNSKLDFECPKHHLDQLKADVAAVTKLLVIGWRAIEPTLLGVWKQPRVAAISKVAVVAGKGEAQAVETNLKDAGIGVPQQLSPTAPETKFITSDEGFSAFVTGLGWTSSWPTDW